jgi:hypothetical protein
MKLLFLFAILFSATLLFMVQPLAGKILLPVLGGSPAVWGTCIVFFQATLFLGYLYAHALSTRVAGGWPQRLVHTGLLIAATITLPWSTVIGDPAGADPRWWVLRVLAGTIGLPFFALSATAPLLQHWFSQTNDPEAQDPYFLYAVSNAGSLVGLLAYLLLEPVATRSLQVSGWSVGFWILAALVTACGYVSARNRIIWLPPSGGSVSAAAKPPANAGGHAMHVSASRRLLWIALATVPSALLLGVTQHLATDVVSAPLLWVVPLALYLLTFMTAFSTRSFGSAKRWGTAAPVVVLLVIVLSLGDVRYPILPIAFVHLAAFTVLAMLCHTRLAESRPDRAHLTGYFVCVSLGGVLGGALAALVAPSVFAWILEYPLGISAALLLRPQSVEADHVPRSAGARWAGRAAATALFAAGYWCVSVFNARETSHLASSQLVDWLQSRVADPEIAERVVRASFVIPAAVLLFWPRAALLFAGTAAGLLVGGSVVRTGGDVLHRERTFFGVHQVAAVGDWHVLIHGTTTHGVQAIRGKLRLLPTAYYHPSGPIGDVVFTLSPEGRFRDVGVVGLGAGALAAYAGTGVRMDFFEIDDAVIRIAEHAEYFTYLADARARPGTTIRTIAIDGRLGLRAMPAASYDLIVVDAFSSDAIPTHLITREAVALYESRLNARGLVAFHLSSRFFDIPPVVATIAADQHLICYLRNDEEVSPERAAQGMRASVWVVLAREERDVGQLAHSAPRWVRLVSNADAPLWTDDFTNLLGVLQ